MAKGINFYGSNELLHAPKTMPECDSLPVHHGPHEFISCWKLDAEELKEVIRTGEVWVSVASESHPPIAISGIPRMVSVSPLNGAPIIYRTDGMHVVPEAMEYAKIRHGDQAYGPYTHDYHLGKVVDILAEFGYGWVYLTSAWLHDVVEDTQPDLTPSQRLNEIEGMFGRTIADMVWAVTAVSEIDGVKQNRKARNQQIYDKIAAFPEAAPLKAGDRIANMEACLTFDDEDKAGMYAKEMKVFMENLGDMLPVELRERLVSTHLNLIDRFPSLEKYKDI